MTPAPAAAGPKQTQSLVGFILGIASVVFCATGLIAIAAGIAAIIISNKAKKSEPGAPSWMHLVGVITGVAGIVLGLIVGISIAFSIIAPLLIASTYGVGNY
ncbi:MAG: hypothetical protein ABIO06_03005 [Pseudolysinimonas sp.]